MIWVVMAVFAFVSAWFFLMSTELFMTIQTRFAGMSDAPTVMSGIVFPMITMQAKLSVFIVSIISGLSFSRLQHENGWFLILSNPQSEILTVGQKYIAGLFVSILFQMPLIFALGFLGFQSTLPFLPLSIALAGLFFLIAWMAAFALFISTWVNNSGFSILLNIIGLLALWSLSNSVLDSSWGKNWMGLLSPQYHFRQYLTDKLALESIYYFLMGTAVLLFAASVRLQHRRYKLN